MQDRYPARYTDAHGTEETVIFNNGETLRMSIRGVTFEDSDFDAFEPEGGTECRLLDSFVLHRNGLCSCKIECDIPIRVVIGTEESLGTLSCRIDLGSPAERGGLDKAELRLILKHAGCEYASSDHSGYFEDQLVDIQKQLPVGVFIKACINCLFSDYSPFGHGMFGKMMCFRNLKKKYLAVRTKVDFWGVHDRFDRFVQETYLCEEFERRVPGTGYRG